MSRTFKSAIKTFVELQLREYPENKKALKSVAAAGDDPRHYGHVSRSVTAIDNVLADATAEELELVRLVYWQRTHTITGAGLALNLGRSTAYRYQDRLIRAIARELGYIR